MANPKLLSRVTVTASNDRIGFTLGAVPTLVAMTTGDYTTILEALANLESALLVEDVTFSVTITSLGIVPISCDNVWTINWCTTDDGFETLMGFSGSETVTGAGPYVLTATDRAGEETSWYSPVGVQYPGKRRLVRRRVDETDDGDAVLTASESTHEYKTLRFSTLLESQIEPDAAQTDADGEGGTTDWTGRTFYDFWVYVADKKFRFYEDGSDGTVASPGTDGTEYDTMVRTDKDSSPWLVDPEGYTYFGVDLPTQITGS